MRRRRWLLWAWFAACCAPLLCYWPGTFGFKRGEHVLVGVGHGSLLLAYDPWLLNGNAWGHTWAWLFQDGGVQKRPFLKITLVSGVLILPAWYLTAGLVVSGLVPWSLARRQPRSGCFQCGYDLTGNVSGVCPECGTAIAPITKH